MAEPLGVSQKSFDDAETDRVNYQNIIVSEGRDGDLIAKTTDLLRFAACIITVARAAEYDAANDADKLRFLLVSQRTFQRQSEGQPFEVIFEEEYINEFG